MALPMEHNCLAESSESEVLTWSQILKTLRMLGGRHTVSYCQLRMDSDEIEEVHSGFLSCSRDVWVSHFGEPEDPQEHRELSERRPMHHWRQRCVEGDVTCIGRLFERCQDGSWVTLTRVTVPFDA